MAERGNAVDPSQERGNDRDSSKERGSDRGDSKNRGTSKRRSTVKIKNDPKVEVGFFELEWRKDPVEDVMRAMEVARQESYPWQDGKDPMTKEDASASKVNGIFIPSEASMAKVKEAALIAVKQDGYAMIYAAKGLKADKEVLIAAVQKKGDALLYAHSDLRDDKDVVLEAVKQDGAAIRYASERLKGDKDCALIGVGSTGMALKHCATPLKADLDVVLRAVQQDGRALRHAADSVKDNREIIFTAVQQDNSAYAYIPPGDLKREIGDWLEKAWGLPKIRPGCVAGQSLTYRDCKGIWHEPPP